MYTTGLKMPTEAHSVQLRPASLSTELLTVFNYYLAYWQRSIRACQSL